ncbi:FeoA family protein [Thioflexithrix psekupsensis]|jgi:ferrous iron transport protein A|uniref:Ferrous iron transport protein A n=1 Tax=Thioflexithrix psekupsensis TaxID=1570016 RepID=A0A251XA16_9GAMM|nr:FeoA family protein [Thioflexithrix psekupsensis]OUD15024.1 ferrous iron transport protein A [Thioflexithrix psekupsensis]
MTTHLSDLKIGEMGRVVGIEKQQKAYRQKLLAMGLTPGTSFSVVRYAPMGDPVEIQVRGFSLSLRQGEAQALQVEKIEK